MEKRRERRGTKMHYVGDVASEKERVEGEEGGVYGFRDGWGEGTEKQQRWEDGVLNPVKKG